MIDRELPGFDDACVLAALGDVDVGQLVFRKDDDGFLVEEIPAYLPSGQGEHLYVFVEKRGLSTPALVKRLGQRLKIDEREIGYAGRKDERGITRQWLSLPARRVAPIETDPGSAGAATDGGGAADAVVAARGSAVDDAIGPEARVLAARLHGNKLRIGHLRGNAFTIAIDVPARRGDGADPSDGVVAKLRARADLLRAGIPNLFGLQRFGAGDSTLRQAEAFVSRSRPARSRREEFWISSFQSALYNAWLADRIDDGTWQKPLQGDVLLKTSNGAPFTCTEPSVDEARLRVGEVCVGGPLIGRGMRPAESEAMTKESRSWSRLGVPIELVLAHPAFGKGDRRAACIRPSHLAVDALCPEGAGVSIRFSLEKGAYATIVLRALLGRGFVDAAFLPHE